MRAALTKLRPNLARGGFTQRHASRSMSGARAAPAFTFSDEQAKFYDDVLARGVFQVWSEKLFEVSRPALGESVLDVACGTGVVARACAREVGVEGSVTAMDNSSGMLERARASGTGGAAARVEFVEGDACERDHGERTFDRAYCQQGLQFMENPTRAMELIRKALKPGGHFTAAVWTTARADSNQMMYHLGEALRDVGKEEWIPIALKPMSWCGSGAADGAGSTKLEDCLISAGFINPDVSVEDGTFEFPSLDVAVDVAKVAPYGAELAGDAELWNAFSKSFRNRLAPFVNADGVVSVPARSFIAHGVAPWNAP